jgi:thiol-disulfide isomerase/thioredoxin
MKQIKFALLAVILIPAVIFAGELNDAQSPSATDENPVFNLEQYRGKVVLLDFWASWCGPCREAFPWLNAMHRKYQSLGLEIIGVNLDEERSLADQFLTKTPADFAIQYDPEGDLAKRYKLQGMPASYLIDRDGKLLVKHIGFFQSEAAQRELEIKQALKK